MQLVYVVWICFETVFCYFFIIETKNRTLEETAALFDGVDAAQLTAPRSVATSGTKDVREEPKLQEKQSHESGNTA